MPWPEPGITAPTDGPYVAAVVNQDDLRVRPRPPNESQPKPETKPSGPGAGRYGRVTLPRIVQWFKTMTTNEYVQGVNERGWAPFDRRLWQRSYYDHVIRDEDELRRVRQYILANPTTWAEDWLGSA